MQGRDAMGSESSGQVPRQRVNWGRGFCVGSRLGRPGLERGGGGGARGKASGVGGSMRGLSSPRRRPCNSGSLPREGGPSSSSLVRSISRLRQAVARLFHWDGNGPSSCVKMAITSRPSTPGDPMRQWGLYTLRVQSSEFRAVFRFTLHNPNPNNTTV